MHFEEFSVLRGSEQQKIFKKITCHLITRILLTNIYKGINWTVWSWNISPSSLAASRQSNIVFRLVLGPGWGLTVVVKITTLRPPPVTDDVWESERAPSDYSKSCRAGLIFRNSCSPFLQLHLKQGYTSQVAAGVLINVQWCFSSFVAWVSEKSNCLFEGGEDILRQWGPSTISHLPLLSIL